MRLINVRDYMFHEYPNTTPPPYAILSHTWQDKEASYQDMVSAQKITNRIARCDRISRFWKIRRTCSLVGTKHHLEYVWIDSCCINKQDSVENSTAINSMFDWYKGAKVCIVFLQDVSLAGYWEQEFRDCRWPTRGWTLQELLAPRDLIFYDKNWDYIGSKGDLLGLLTDATGIDCKAISNDRQLESFSAAQKMSWAAGRKTTKVGDIAYCLLGIFRVDIRISYGGEGERTAFRRLQIEILKKKDFSILSWDSLASLKPGEYTCRAIPKTHPANHRFS
ncbi:heterokaryon incompatibility protein-domain-containing protein [Xylariaceae sp. FL1651]|nr:heterokaryon incompatibility protein-domain-containing protein [Xylariaceae sp. FL1651]